MQLLAQSPIGLEAEVNVRKALEGWPTNEELFQQYGTQAPRVLNQYACALEDELGQVQDFAARQHEVLERLKPHIDRYQNLEQIVFDPDKLAQWTTYYLAPDGPAAQQVGQVQQPVQQVPQPQGEMLFNSAEDLANYQQALRQQEAAAAYQQQQIQSAPPAGAPDMTREQYEIEAARLEQERMQQLAARQQQPQQGYVLPGGMPNTGSQSQDPAAILRAVRTQNPAAAPYVLDKLINSGAFR
jgi:hypothetical protein